MSEQNEGKPEGIKGIPSMADESMKRSGARSGVRARLDELERGMETTERMASDYEEDNRVRDLTRSAEAKAAELRSAADQVHDDYKAELAKLYRSDGSKKYSETEHAERENALTQRRDDVFAELKKRADALSAKTGEKLEAARVPAKLGGREMERANVRREFVREDVDSKPLAEVPALLRSAELSGDRVEKWLAARYALMRAERELEALRQSGGGGVRGGEASGHILEIRTKAQALQESLREPFANVRREGLERLHNEALDAGRHVAHKSITEEERIARSSSPFRN